MALKCAFELHRALRQLRGSAYGILKYRAMPGDSLSPDGRITRRQRAAPETAPAPSHARRSLRSVFIRRGVPRQTVEWGLYPRAAVHGVTRREYRMRWLLVVEQRSCTAHLRFERRESGRVMSGSVPRCVLPLTARWSSRQTRLGRTSAAAAWKGDGGGNQERELERGRAEVRTEKVREEARGKATYRRREVQKNRGVPNGIRTRVFNVKG